MGCATCAARQPWRARSGRRAAVVVDAGPMHIAAAVGCPTVCIFGNGEDGTGASPLDLRAPRVPNAYIVRTPATCRACVEQRFKNDACLVAGHPRTRELRPERAIAALERALKAGKQSALTP